MGVLGGKLGGYFGKHVGSMAANQFKKSTGVGCGPEDKSMADIGESFGKKWGGRLVPFKKGGRVKRTGPALVHKGEFVLPAGVKPTKSQVAAVRRRKAMK